MDNTIYSESDSSNGEGDFLFTGFTNVGNERRALLKFEIAETVDTAAVMSARLQLYMSKTISGEIEFTLHRLVSPWGESSSDARFEEGGGATPMAGDATWQYAFYDTASWTNAGGDFDSIASATAAIGEAGTYVITVTEDVKLWISRPELNNGWILLSEDEGLSAKRFNSGENIENPPVLQILIQSDPADGLPANQVQDIRVYPNPSDGNLFLSFKGKIQKENIKIIALDGGELPGVQIREQPAGVEISIGQRGAFMLVAGSIHKLLIVR